jgi:hypothetical protein
MDKRSTGIIATVATVLLCGLPGLLSLCIGLVTAGVGFIPGAEIDMFGSNEPRSALFTGLGLLCLGVIAVAIPVAVGIFTLRKPPEAEPGPVSDEPIPPPL